MLSEIPYDYGVFRQQQYIFAFIYGRITLEQKNMKEREI